MYLFSNQVATGDAWASEVARPLFSEKDSSVMGFFFIYTVIGQTLLINVVVAVSQSESERERECRKRERIACAHTKTQFLVLCQVLLDNFSQCVNEEENQILETRTCSKHQTGFRHSSRY